MKKNTAATENDKEIFIDMPEVKDIPGQEHIKPPKFGEMRDSTPSSADEEGEGILDDLNADDDDELVDDESNVSELDQQMLDQADRPVTEETLDRRKLALDKDEDTEELNEEGNPEDLGEDLDIPGSDLDDEDEELGEEDEENNTYSRND